MSLPFLAVFLVLELGLRMSGLEIPSPSGYMVKYNGPYRTDANPTTTLGSNFVTHPYLGLSSQYYKDRVAEMDYNPSLGTPPIDSDRRVCKIAVFGGSGAWYYAVYEKEKKFLTNYIAKNFNFSRCKKYSLLNFSLSGSMAPMQLYTFIQNLDIIDFAIILDGYNEINLPALDPKVYPIDFPAWYYYIDFMYLVDKKASINSPETIILKLIYKNIESFSEETIFKNIKLFQYFSGRVLVTIENKLNLLGNELKHELFKYKEGTEPPAMHFSLQAGEFPKYLQVRVGVWKKSSLLMGKIGKIYGIPVIHALQPIVNDANKKLTTKEKYFLEGMGKKINYNKFYHPAIQDLEKHKISVHNLSNIFKNEDEPVFKDAVHLTDLGLKIQSEEIIKIIQEDGLKDFMDSDMRVNFSLLDPTVTQSKP